MDAPPLNHHEPTADQITEDPPLLPQVPGAKLRLMCSYGGHIMPRAHDKSLTYVGGDTRMVAVERHTSLKELCIRLSRTLLQGRAFTLKYQLPNEDLDNLISVTTDDDLENMIQEYERLQAAYSNRPSRLRVFLFSSKLDTAVSMGPLLDDANSDTWFVDALNNSGILDRVVSDSAAVESLVSLDADADADAVAVAAGGSNKTKEEEDGGSRLQLVMEEQFAQLTFGNSAAATHVMVSRDDDTSSSSCHQPPPPAPAAAAGHGKPPLPLQLVHPPRAPASFGLPSPDSVASDSSIASANSLSKGVYYQEQQQQREQVQDSTYTLPQQQQHFVYIHQQHHNNPTSTASYYPVYAPPTPSLHHHHHHQQQQQQYPAVYVMPVGPTQPYAMTMQSNMIPHDPNAVAYKDATPPINYPPTKLVSTSALPDLAPKAASTPPPPPPAAAATAFVQIPSNQYVALPTATNYGYDQYGGGPTSQQEQVQAYYTQQQSSASQYQSMTPAAVAAALSDVSIQFPVDS